MPSLFQNISFGISVNLDDLSGRFLLLHHVADSLNYHYLALPDSTVSLGMVADGESQTLSRKNVAFSGWSSVKVVGVGGRFRGYVNGELVVHAHAPKAGRSGLMVERPGFVEIRRVVVAQLRTL